MRKIIFLILLLNLVGCKDNNCSPVDNNPLFDNMVAGRPRDQKDNKLLIPDRLSNYGYVWVEINYETELPDNFPEVELWRHHLEFEIKDLDKSSYPWNATAVKANYPAIYEVNYNVLGPIVKVKEESIWVNTLDEGMTIVNIEKKPKFCKGVSDEFEVGNLVEITYDVMLESFPGKTSAKAVLINEKDFVPDIIIDYLGKNSVYLGMYRKMPLYYNTNHSYDSDYEESIDNHTIVGGSFSDYVFLVNDEIMTLTYAIENGLFNFEGMYFPDPISGSGNG
ncbi:hypothetical protein KHQ82_09070 [Mycoplasmatota bacterium]|nr:hypothetical protein KHQ82_09070 [Mycoplasmatota bacterium]